MNEGPKRALFLQGRRSSDKLRRLTKDLFDIKKPDAQLLNKKNDITIFEDATPVERFCRKFETPLFVMSSHSKKRPDNLVIGRMYNYSLLDMIELHVENIECMREFACQKIVLGTKPSLVFNGPTWEETEELKHLKSLFIDIFHREEVESVRLQGLEHTISFTATPEGKILIRSFNVLMKKSGTRVPRLELEEMGEFRNHKNNSNTGCFIKNGIRVVTFWFIKETAEVHITYTLCNRKGNELFYIPGVSILNVLFKN